MLSCRCHDVVMSVLNFTCAFILKNDELICIIKVIIIQFYVAKKALSKTSR